MGTVNLGVHTPATTSVPWSRPNTDNVMHVGLCTCSPAPPSRPFFRPGPELLGLGAESPCDEGQNLTMYFPRSHSGQNNICGILCHCAWNVRCTCFGRTPVLLILLVCVKIRGDLSKHLEVSPGGDTALAHSPHPDQAWLLLSPSLRSASSWGSLVGISSRKHTQVLQGSSTLFSNREHKHAWWHWDGSRSDDDDRRRRYR